MKKTYIIRAIIAISLSASALSSFAQTPTPTTSPAPKLDLACMQSAVEKRDGAVITALDTYYNAAKTALSDRQSALKTAWSITDRKPRREALQKAWTAFRTGAKTARSTFRTSRASAWEQFNTDRKACGKGATEEFGGQGADAQL